MKLLPLACFAASAAQSGDYDYGSSVDDDRHDYGYSSYGNYDDYGNKKNNWTFGGKAIDPGTHQAIAIALNCWPANFDYDTLMMRDAGNANPSEHHTYGPIHVYGSEMHSRYADINGGASFTSEDPPARSGMGGHYHYGHAHSDATWNSAPSTWVQYHSARHAGCLYEINDFTYNSVSWDRVFHLWYYNGYYDRADYSTVQLANSDSVVYNPNWVHFFNAHVLPSTGGRVSVDPNATAHTAANSIKLVMANPQYEGLGWLNFVATYGKDGHLVGDAYQEFADSTHVTPIVAKNTYTAINDDGVGGVQQTQGTTGNYYYDAWMGTWEMNMDDAESWTMTYDETNSAAFAGVGGLGSMAISSFPHNELGKDFRFNMRVLLCDLNNSDRKMYYFYKINSITVTFPRAVAYALYSDGRAASGSSASGGTNVAGTRSQGDGVYNVAQNGDRDNIVPPLDLGSHMDASFGQNIASTNEHHRITGYLSNDPSHYCTTSNPACADFCVTPGTDCAISANTCAAVDLETHCSTVFYITGLLNTYSERAGQRGTYQEIWVQLSYALGQGAINTGSGPAANLNVGGSNDIVSSPFPYLHFMAYEVVSAVPVCDDWNVDNGNQCGAFSAPRTHDFGFGG